MCGISGYIGHFDAQTRLALVAGMACGIDKRGSHGAGYVSVDSEGKVAYGRRLGYWATAKPKFFYAAASGIATIQHARFATCGKRTVNEVHPFAIDRNGRTVLWGVHNGVLYTADESAKRHGRKPHAVDSVEALQLVADRKYDAVEDISGYGTLAWIENDNRQTVRLVKMTGSADLEIGLLTAKDGTVGYAFASTYAILKDAAELAGCTVANTYTLNTGTVYDLSAEKGPIVSGDVVKLKSWTYTHTVGQYNGAYGWHDNTDDAAYADWWEQRYGNYKEGGKVSGNASGTASRVSSTVSRTMARNVKEYRDATATTVDAGWEEEWRKYVGERGSEPDVSADTAVAVAVDTYPDDASYVDDESGELRMAWEASLSRDDRKDALAADEYARKKEARDRYKRLCNEAKDAALCGNWSKHTALMAEADKVWTEAYDHYRVRKVG